MRFISINTVNPIKLLGYSHDIAVKSQIYPYSWKFWRELNLAVEAKITIAKILADLNLAVQYGIAICTILYASRKFWRILIWQL